MLAKTMGAAKAFEYRRTELDQLLGNPNELDEAALDRRAVRSLIEEICTDDQIFVARHKKLIWGHDHVLPEKYRGQIRKYLDHGKIMHLNGPCFFSHAGFNPQAFPFELYGNKDRERNNFLFLCDY